MSLVRRDEATKTSKNDQKSKACRYRRRPRGPVNIGSRSTCATALWHRISFENSSLEVDVFGDFLVIFWSFFDVFVASSLRTLFRPVPETDF